MIKFNWLAFGVLVSLVSGLGSPHSQAAEPVSLFDGKTLDGWDFDPDIWRVEDGVITGGSTTEKIKENFFIATEKSYQNFELQLTIKCSGDPGTGMINSGIQIRSVRVPGGNHMSGYQVDCGKGWFGKIYDEFRRRKVIAEPVDAAALEKVVDVYGWNTYRIRAEGPRIRVWINDVLAIDYTEDNPNVALDGQIAPQVHSGGIALVQVKEVTIEELPATPGAPTWESLGGVDAAMKLAPPDPKPAGDRKGKGKSKAQPQAQTPPPPPPKPPAQPAKKTQSARVDAWSPAQELAGFTVPDGFTIELVASEENGVINPIDLAFDDAGRLWTQTARMYPLDPISGLKWKEFLSIMADEELQKTHPRIAEIRDLYQLKTKGQDQILIHADPTQPAKGPLHVWADGLSIPQSILPHKDGAYVCHGSELFLLRDTDGDDESDTVETVLSGFGFTDTHTMSHLLVRGPGRYVHFSQGALNQGMVTAVASGNQHRVDASCQVRFALDHQDFEVLSAGPSNMWGLQLRANGQWYGTEANDRAYSVIPWEHGAAVTGAAFRPMRPYQPLIPELHQFRVGGTGISGLEFSDDASGSFPVEEWKDVALLANCITSTINAVRIHRNPDGTVEAEHLPDFLTSEDDWFRPVNLEFGPDGSLYVADFYNKIISHNEVTTDHPERDHSHGRIWRIRHESQPARKIPNVAKATPEQLLTHLQAPSLWEKRAAWHQIGDRGLSQLAPALVAIAADEKTGTVTRIHALWSLEELGHFESGLLDNLLASKDDDLRREAVRSLASFDLAPAEVAARLAGFIEDPNAMVRSQTIRTLGDLEESDPAVIALLIEACRPALKGNAMGGPYERNLERFLARMALEKFPTQLKNYLAASAGKHPGANILWAIQALDDEAKKKAFLAIWNNVSEQDIDSETFVAIAGMLGDREVYAAVAPTFQDPSKAKNLVSLALGNQSRVQSPQLIEILTPAVSHLLKTSGSYALALSAVGKLKMKTMSQDVAGFSPRKADLETLRLLLSAQMVNPKPNAPSFQAIAANEMNPLDLRIEAAHALAPFDEKESYRLTRELLTGADPAGQAQIANLYSQSKPGAQLLCALHGDKAISADAFDLSAAERVKQAHPGNPQATAIFTTVRKRIAEQKQQAQARIHQLMAWVGKHPGDPDKGKITFAACLACHKVGDEGQEVGPPLDGSGYRELEHLLTAILDPDAAVEGGYGLYRITKTDGSVVEGLLEKQEPLGTTIAMMGGARLFTPIEQINKAGFVGGRSVMLPVFGQLPDETIADLVAYIATLKQGDPPPPPKPSAAVARPAYDHFEPLGDFRFTFESGDLEGWKVVAGDLGNPVSSLPSLVNWKHQPFNREGDYHLSTIPDGTAPGDKATGVLQSPSFKLEGEKISFLVSGGFDDANLFVGLYNAATGGRLLAAGGPKGPQMQRVTWDVKKWIGETVYLQIVDNKEKSWAHLTFDDFSAQATPANSPAPAPKKAAQFNPKAPRPNIVVFFTDDQGYNDVGCFGSPLIKTPHLDRMAAEGLRLTNFYAQPVCGVSRAALMTGSYPIRVGEPGNQKNLHTILHPEEITVAEVLRDAGYATGMVGKWHLAGGGRGDSWNRDLLPNAQGFDDWFGAPSHNGTSRLVPPGKGHAELMRNGEIVDPMVDQKEMGQLTKHYTQEAIRFIKQHGSNQGRAEGANAGAATHPFFLYLAHTMPHVPINASQEFLGKSKRGLYGDVIEELDWSMGQILAELKRLELDDNTLVIFTADNGPWIEKHLEGEGGTDSHCGSADPLRGWKMSAWEGGCRVPFIARWPGKIPAGRVSDDILSTMDFLPTFASLAGAALPDRKLDGHDATGFLLGKTGTSPRNDYLYYTGCLLTGVRDDRWKLVRPRPANPPGTGWWGRMIEAIPDFELYDLANDPGETKNLAKEHPEIVARLKKSIELARNELGDIDLVGSGARLHDEGPRTLEAAKPRAKAAASASSGQAPRPNFVVIFTDDQGYGDLSCFGGEHVHTPRIDQMAAEGAKLTSFYVAAPVCTPSRAALMTGSYPRRIDMATGSNFAVLLAGDPKGLHPDEITIAEVLKSAGYKTGIFGKWHLGDQPEFLPTRQGFDESFGIPFSHDIHPFHPNQKHFNFPALALLDQEKVIEMDPDADFLTRRLTERAVDFIERNKDNPFFLYLPHPIPHKPLHVSPPFMKGVPEELRAALAAEPEGSVDYKLRDQLFRQAIAEIDWSVGRILDTLAANRLDENTLVLFTSDNGPAIGQAGPLRGKKGSTFEGGMREATVVRWPGHIPAGATNDELMTAMDLLPTFAGLAGAEVPAGRVLDGKDIWPVLSEGAKTPHETFFYHGGNTLKAVRSGDWKLHVADGKPAQLYNLKTDIGEKTNVLAANPAIVKRLAKYLADFEQDIALNSRPAAFVDNPRPLSK